MSAHPPHLGNTPASRVKIPRAMMPIVATNMPSTPRMAKRTSPATLGNPIKDPRMSATPTEAEAEANAPYGRSAPFAGGAGQL